MTTLTWGLTGTISGLQNNTQGNVIAAALATRSNGASAPTTGSTGLASTACLDWHDTAANLRKTRNEADTAWIIEGLYDETDGLYSPMSDGPAGTVRSFLLRTAGVARWSLGASLTAESGSNAGSDFVLTGFNDAGGVLATAMSVTRSNGQVTFPQAITADAGTTVIVPSTGIPLAQFKFTTTNVGSINTNGTTTAYNTTSDQRLKIDEGAFDATDSGSIIDRLKPRWFRWKSAPEGEAEPGFFAQQVHKIFPWAVTKGNGRPDRKDFAPWQLDAGKLMPVVIAELQALRARVAELEAR
jgi:hypothetical protein